MREKMKKLGIAIVGCGSVTERGLIPHLLLEKNRIEIVALCDKSEFRLDEISQKFHIPKKKTFTNLEEMLEISDVKAVAIATPIQKHFEQAKATLLAGRHVYVQKTMTETPREAKELIQLANKTGLKLAASPGQLLLPAYQKARELINAGKIGKIYNALSHNIASGHEDEPIRNSLGAQKTLNPAWYYQKGGGPLRDMGIYSIHAITGMLGQAQEVISIVANPIPKRSWEGKEIKVETPDNVMLVMKMENEILANVCASFSITPIEVRWGHIAISGSQGSIDVRRTGKIPAYRLTLNNSEGIKTYEYGSGLSAAHDRIQEAHVARDLLDFTDAILNNRSPLASAYDALHCIEIITAAEYAAKTGKTIQVSGKREKRQ